MVRGNYIVLDSTSSTEVDTIMTCVQSHVRILKERNTKLGTQLSW